MPHLPPALQNLDPRLIPVLLATAAFVAWYVAVRAAGNVARDPAARLLVGGAVPALAGCAWAAAAGRPEAALALATGVAVASVALVLGLVATSKAVGRPVLPDPQHAGLAALLPVAVTLLLIGFSGAFTVLHALLLLAEAVLVGWVLRSTTPPVAAVAGESPRAGRTVAAIQMTLAAVLAVAGAGFIWSATGAAGRLYGSEVDGRFATAFVAPLLALPLIGMSVSAASDGRGPATQRGLVLLAVAMVTVAVPLVVLITFGRDVSATLAANGLEAGLKSLWQTPPVTPMPVRLWRIDSVVLCIVGILLLPPAAGRFRLGVAEGVGLLLLYVAYLILSVAAAR